MAKVDPFQQLAAMTYDAFSQKNANSKTSGSKVEVLGVFSEHGSRKKQEHSTTECERRRGNLKQAYSSLAGAPMTVKCVTDLGCELLLERFAKWGMVFQTGMALQESN